MSPRKPATPDEGKPEDLKLDVAAKDAKEAASVEASVTERERSEAPKPRRRLRRKAEPQAEGTAAEPVTERERSEAKDVVEAATKEGASGPVTEPAEEPAPADEPIAADEPAVAKPKKAEAAEAETAAPEAAPAPKPRRARRKAEPEAPAAPASARKRAPRDYGDAPPMVRAHAKYVRTSARKARLVCDHIRGKSVEEARAILAHANRDVARDWSKLLESAVANAEHNHELIGDELRIHAVKADEGPTLKRFRPRAMGRATKIRKRTSHLSITLTPKDEDR
jgi:large subunit ribosomal protein L22